MSTPAKKVKKDKSESNLMRHVFILYIAALVILVGIAGIVAFLVRPIQQDTAANTLVIRTYIKEAVENMSHPTTIDPKEKKEYIYEASVRFPAQPSNNFRYAYTPKKDDTKEEILIVSDPVFSAASSGLSGATAEQLFSNVPRLQACIREFVIYFEEGLNGYDGEYDLVSTIRLADGRTAYLHRNKTCASHYDDDALNVATDQAILEKLESY